MTVKEIHIDELIGYVAGAFKGDDDIVFYYDRNEKVKTVDDASNNVVEKIRKIYSGSELRGVQIDGERVGYFVFADELLISFGMNKKYRNKEVLSEMWDEIKKELGATFQCLLYSYNVRGVEWLRKCGMDILFENITILRFNNQLN